MPVRVHTRGRLPHWTHPGAEYFITFRTFEAISPETLAALRMSRYTPDERRREIQLALDRCDRGDLLQGEIAQCVAETILHGHTRDYDLRQWCVMPNHVHLLVRMQARKSLAPAMQAIKSVSAHRINRYLAKTGPVWEREYFDRLVRSGESDTVRAYILQNPLRAGLVNWKWVGDLS